MTHGNCYLGKLYNDLIANSPQTISMDIPSDMGQWCGIKKVDSLFSRIS